MKLAFAVLVAGSVLFQPVFAQHGGTGGTNAGGSRSGGRSPRPGRFLAPPPVSHPVHGPAVVVPYPVFYGLPYYCDPAYCNPGAGGDRASGPAPANSYDDGSGYGAPGQTPVVIMNQSFQPPVANPVMHDYSNTPLPPAPPDPNAPRDDEPTIYLIAMADHSIVAAIAYWVDGDTLDYITQDGDQNRVSLALVDREFSRKLNTDRGLEFRLPAAK
ncbi:MAG TPA: hypothetical protein VKX39_19420 [Bryobacteraceae bacterium]|jgi:hypothetical protein|nr:hypothetical protein [Bryobacteraceae bacterium]